MKNFIFKSSDLNNGLIKNVFNKLDILLAEQKHQRSDLSILLALSKQVINSLNLQKQVDDYFDEDEDSKHIPEESKDEQ